MQLMTMLMISSYHVVICCLTQ